MVSKPAKIATCSPSNVGISQLLLHGTERRMDGCGPGFAEQIDLNHFKTYGRSFSALWEGRYWRVGGRLGSVISIEPPTSPFQ